MGHYANECPSKKDNSKNNDKTGYKSGFTFAQSALNLTQMNGQLKPQQVLLDTQSSCVIFNNANLLHDVKSESGTGLKPHSNGEGYIETNMTGVVSGYGKVWYHPATLRI